MFKIHPNSCECELFAELHLFKKKVEEGRSGLHHCPYTVNRDKILIYKTIFLLLSAIFGLASIYVYKSYLNWCCILLFGTPEIAKSLMSSFCTLLSLGSLYIGLRINPIHEIVNLIKKKYVKQAREIYFLRKREVSDLYFCGSVDSLNIFKTQKQIYRDLLKSMQIFQENTLLTMKRIHLSKLLSNLDKEKLFNQAILELQFQFETVINQYKKNLFNLNFQMSLF